MVPAALSGFICPTQSMSPTISISVLIGNELMVTPVLANGCCTNMLIILQTHRKTASGLAIFLCINLFPRVGLQDLLDWLFTHTSKMHILLRGLFMRWCELGHVEGVLYAGCIGIFEKEFWLAHHFLTAFGTFHYLYLGLFPQQKLGGVEHAAQLLVQRAAFWLTGIEWLANFVIGIPVFSSLLCGRVHRAAASLQPYI